MKTVKCKPYPKEKAVVIALYNTPKVQNTVRLLDEIYNGTTTLKKIESENLRSKLIREIMDFQEILFEYFDDTYSSEEKEGFKNKIIRHLKPESNFTAFKRWIIRENETLMQEFSNYL